MSWDIIVQDFPSDAKTVADISRGFQPLPLGARDELTSRILAICPDADFSDPTCGIIQGSDWSIEVSLGQDVICNGFTFHVRGGDAAVGVVAAILDHLRLRAIDCQTTEFFSVGAESMASFHAWRAYRNRVVEDQDADSR